MMPWACLCILVLGTVLVTRSGQRDGPSARRSTVSGGDETNPSARGGDSISSGRRDSAESPDPNRGSSDSSPAEPSHLPNPYGAAASARAGLTTGSRSGSRYDRQQAAVEGWLSGVKSAVLSHADDKHLASLLKQQLRNSVVGPGDLMYSPGIEEQIKAYTKLLDSTTRLKMFTDALSPSTSPVQSTPALDDTIKL